jgi:hypothetical protein
MKCEVGGVSMSISMSISIRRRKRIIIRRIRRIRRELMGNVI